MSPRRRVMPALVGGVIVAGTVGGFFATRSSSREPSTAELQSTAATAAAVATAHLDADTQLLNATAASIGGNTGLPEAQLRSALRRNAPRDRVLAIVRTNADAASAVVVATSDTTPSIVGADIATSAARRVVLELARDRAGTGAAIVNRADGQSSLVDALPVYGTLDAPTDIVGRRSALNGFVVSITPLASIIGLPRGPESEISARIVDGDHVLGAFGRGAGGSPNGSVVDLPLNANGLAWSVQAWSTPRASSLPWVVLFGGLLVAALATAAVTSRERSIAAAVAETEARNEELALVARTGPLLQQSLALGDLLPVFVVEIGDELGLDSASISLVSESGQLTRVFSLGSGLNAPEPDIVTVEPPAQSVPPGEMVTVPLQRVGRVVGAFQARAVRGLSHPQMETLQAVCALLAAAIGNVRLFQEEQDMVARLRDVDRMKTSFIGSVSHELRTSVTAIQGFAALLDGDVGDLDAERRADYVERISRNARSLGILVEDLLDFARFERSGLTAALRPVDLSDLVPKVVEQLSSVLDGRLLSTTIEPGVVALADALAVERVLANLLSNAGKYTPPHSEVAVGLERNGDAAVLWVTDNGPGVAADEREKIFELFYRSDESARVTRGVGIGLALTRQLVMHLNGTVAVDDAPGGGARFRVTIPLANQAPSSAAPSRSDPARKGAGG